MYYIGVDLGGTNIAVGLVSKEGNLLYKHSVKTEREKPHEAVIKNIVEACKTLLSSNNIKVEDIEYIGIGLPGTCNSEKGIIEYAPNINFKNVNIRKEMKKYFDHPIYIDNDANCAALGESIAGSAKDYDSSITVTLGTGIGGGVIVGKKIVTGAFGGAGEIGHQIIKAGGELCGCGNRGCFEAYASATALIRESKIAAIKNPNTKILELANNDINLIDPKIVFAALDDGDIVAKEVIDNYLYFLAVGLGSLINILQPDVIVIGGGVSKQEDNLINPLKELVRENVLGKALKTEIKVAKLGNDAGIIGAGMLKA